MTIIELESLINALNDNQISTEDLARLESELTSNPASMQIYLDMMDMENMLSHQCNLNDHIIRPVVSVDRMLKHQRIATWRRVAFATAALLMIGIVALSLLNISDNDALTFKLGPDTRYSLNHAKGSELSEGLVMETGSRLKIEYGTVELNFESGVKAVIEAPADIEMLAADQVKMRYGTAWYNVPSGAEGFTVLTDELRVVDLGTEFGVKASLKNLDEVHVMKGKVQVTSRRASKQFEELIAGQARKIDPIGGLKEIPLKGGLFIAALPSKQQPYVAFEDQINKGVQKWRIQKGNVIAVVGDYRDTACPINTSGDDDHSLVHFDLNGIEIKSSGRGYLCLGDEGQLSPNLVSTQFDVHKGRKYTVYFQHAGSHNGSQKIAPTVTMLGKTLASHKFDCLDRKWTSSTFTFVADEDGVATLSFDNAGSTISDNSDTLLDSVLITSSPL